MRCFKIMKLRTSEIVLRSQTVVLCWICVSFTTQDQTTWVIKSDLKIIWVIKFVTIQQHSHIHSCCGHQHLYSDASFFLLLSDLKKAKPLNSL